MASRGFPQLPKELCTIIDAVAEAEASLRIASAARGTTHFKTELEKLRTLVPVARKLVDGYKERIANEITVSLRMSEMGLAELSKL